MCYDCQLLFSLWGLVADLAILKNALSVLLLLLLLLLFLQVSCAGPELEVIKRDRFWGQGDVVLGPATGPGEYSLPLGELEFLLDQQGRKELP